MSTTQTTFIAKGDLLWVQSEVDWTSGVRSLAGLLFSTRQFIDSYNIRVDDVDVNGNAIKVQPSVRSPFTVEFENVEEDMGLKLAVQGIHNTSRLTVMMDMASILNFVESENLSVEYLALRSNLVDTTATAIPTMRTIMVSLVPNVEATPLDPRSATDSRVMIGRAYIHWEISANDTTPRSELTKHVFRTLASTITIEEEYRDRLAFRTNPGHATFSVARFLKKDGTPLTTAPSVADMDVEYTDPRNVSCEVDESQSTALSCNSDIGTYWVDSSGVIHIVVDNTIIKMY